MTIIVFCYIVLEIFFSLCTFQLGGSAKSSNQLSPKDSFISSL